MRPVSTAICCLLTIACSTSAIATAEFLHRGSLILDPVALAGDNDRLPEPGETFDLILTLNNEGDDLARNVTATLISNDPQLTVMPAPAVSFPDMAIGAFATSVAPHFRLTANAAIACGKAVNMDLRVSFNDSLGSPHLKDVRFLIFVGEPLVLYHEDYDQGPAGWNHDPLSSTGGSDGGWVNAAPQTYTWMGLLAQPGNDVSYPDVSCFYTGQNINTADPTQFNVTGTKGLISKIYDLSGRSGVYLSYFRWFYSDDLSNADVWLMEGSADGGTSWVTIEQITTRDNRWVPVAFLLDPLLPLTNDMRFRVTVTDGGIETVCEAAIDEMTLLTSSCNRDPLTARLASEAPIIDDSLDPACTDNDGIPDAGETFAFSVTVENTGTAPAANTVARLVTIPAGLMLYSANPIAVGNLADNGGSGSASWTLRVDDGVTCQSNLTLDVVVTADPPFVATPTAYAVGVEEDVNQPIQRWFDDFDSGLPAWTVQLYGIVNDWALQQEDCAMNPGTPPTPARNFWFTGSTGFDPTDCSVTPYRANHDAGIRSPRIDTGYINPQLLELKWNQLLTMTPPPDADAAEVWIDHDDDGVFTRIARYQGQVTTNGDTLDPAVIDLPNNPEGADLSMPTQFIQVEVRFFSDATGGGGNPLGLGWIFDNVELTWIDGDGRSCDANTCALCQSMANINPSKIIACKDEPVVFDGAASMLTACPYFGTRTYQWFRNGTPVGTGTPSLMIVEPAVGLFTYRLDVGCSTLPGCTSTTSQVLDVRDCLFCASTATIAPASNEECAGTPVPLDASASLVLGCPAPGVTTFQWNRNGTPVVGATMSMYTANEAVGGNYSYTVDVGCSTDAACTDTSTAHGILFKPNGPCVSVGNILKGRRQGQDVEMSWNDTQPFAIAWNVYRSTNKTLPGTPTLTPSPFLDLMAINPVPDSLYFYNVRALNCSMLEGP